MGSESEVLERLARIETQLAALVAMRAEDAADRAARNARHEAERIEQEHRMRKVEIFQARIIGIALVVGTLPGALISWLLSGR